MKTTIKQETTGHVRPRIYVFDRTDGKTPLFYSNGKFDRKAQREIIIKALRRVGLDLIAQDLRFRRTLGCSCGCSPGFEIVSPVDDRHHREYIVEVR